MRRFLLLLASVVALMLTTVSSVAAQQDSDGPSAVVVHRVDARTSPIEVTAIANEYTSDTVTINENGQDKDVAVSSPSLPSEIVFVVDSSQRLRSGDALQTATAALAEQIRSLPSNTAVGIVEAANTAIVVSEMTTDHNAAAAAVQTIDFSEGGKLYNAMDKAVAMLSEPAVAGEAEAIQTLVVFAGGPDAGSSVEIDGARAGLIRRGAQAVAIQYKGGDASLGALADSTGGLVFRAAGPAKVADSTTRASQAAGSRIVVRYDGVLDSTERGDATLKFGGAETSYSYGGGELWVRSIALTPSTDVSSGSLFGFFQSMSSKFISAYFFNDIEHALILFDRRIST